MYISSLCIVDEKITPGCEWHEAETETIGEIEGGARIHSKVKMHTHMH